MFVFCFLFPLRPDVLERPFPTMLMLFHPAGGPSDVVGIFGVLGFIRRF